MGRLQFRKREKTSGFDSPFLGVVGFVVSVAVGKLVEVATTRTLVCSALVLAIGSVVPAALLSANITTVATGAGFWAFVFPTTMLSVSAVSVAYNVLSITLRPYPQPIPDAFSADTNSPQYRQSLVAPSLSPAASSTLRFSLVQGTLEASLLWRLVAHAMS
jgi:hypothetical protein